MKTRDSMVSTHLVRAFCDECEHEMMFTGEAQMSNPPKFSHVCRLCGKQEWLTEQYPRQEHRETIIISDIDAEIV